MVMRLEKMAVMTTVMMSMQQLLYLDEEVVDEVVVDEAVVDVLLMHQ